MPEEMRVETMELCVTACEKFSNNNEVLPSVWPLVPWVTPVAPVPASSYRECRWGQAKSFLGSIQSAWKAGEGRSWCYLGH